MISPASGLNFMIGHRGLMNAQSVIAQAAERLATGKRINRTSDDPSGALAADEFTRRIRAIEGKLKTFDLEEARLGATEGALSVVHDMAHRLQGIVVQAANRAGMSAGELEALQIEVDGIIEGMDFIANTSVFKGEKLFEGLFSTRFGMNYKIEDHPSQRVTLASLKSGGLLNMVSGDLEAAQEVIDQAVAGLSGRRAAIGNRITNTIEPERALLLAEMEQSESARSELEDADIAAEMSNLIRGQILQQAAIGAMLISRQSPQSALDLLAPNLELAKK